MDKPTKTILSVALLLILASLVMLQFADGFIGETTIRRDGNQVNANRCDHLVTPPATNDAWTAVGIAATFRDDDQWSSAYYFFRRAFGGLVMSPHDWTVYGSLMCNAIVDSSSYISYHSESATWQYYQSPYWPAYYHDYSQNIPIGSDAGYRVGANCGTWFRGFYNPDNWVYISSAISSSDMIASGPNYQG